MKDIPVAVPVYVHRKNIHGELPGKGDAVMMSGWFYVDFFNPQIPDKEYLERHPKGLEVPRIRVPGSLEFDEESECL